MAAPDAGRSEARDLFSWLLDLAPPEARPCSAVEERLLAALEAVAAGAGVPDALLPRAAAFVPQLLALLEDDERAPSEVAGRIAQDPPLAAEVLHAATNAAYLAAGPVRSLTQAVQRIGAAGVQRAVARVVFRPMFAAGGDSLGAGAAPRLWQHAEALSDAAARAASDDGLPPFDGYLAGLLHGVGWMVALRVIDKDGATLPLPPSAGFAAALDRLAHRVFGLAAQRWRITPGFTALGEDARRCALQASELPLAASLRRALATRLSAPGPAPDA